MPEKITCSLTTCSRDILGMAVILASADDEGIPWAEGGFDTYVGENRKEWVMLHPTCFQNLFEEMCRAGVQTNLMFSLGSMRDIREALSM